VSDRLLRIGTAAAVLLVAIIAPAWPGRAGSRTAPTTWWSAPASLVPVLAALGV